ncbi:MAG: hypothetical protein AAGA54_06170 [Myxococcota bacterium]
MAVVILGTEMDVWPAARVTSAWSKRVDVERVEVISWDVTQSACAMLPGVDVVHALPLANLRARARMHALAPAAALDAALQGIVDGRAFDHVLNMTYARTSGFLAPLLARSPHAVVGPFIGDAGDWRWSHPALAYLATWGLDPALNVFAHQDLWATAARVRMDEGGTLDPDPVADNLAASAIAQGRPAPLVVVPAKLSRPVLGGAWEDLVSMLMHRNRRPVMLMATPRNEMLIAPLARRTGAEVARWPTRHLAALMRRSAGVLTADHGASLLAARVGVKQIVLRPAKPLPCAALPGPNALMVTPQSGLPSAEDVQTLAATHLLGLPLAESAVRLASRRFEVREVAYDKEGCLAASLPAWWDAPPQRRAEDETLAAWRSVWRSTWLGIPPAPADVLHVLTRGDETRVHRACHDRGPLGEALRAMIDHKTKEHVA